MNGTLILWSVLSETGLPRLVHHVDLVEDLPPFWGFVSEKRVLNEAFSVSDRDVAAVVCRLQEGHGLSLKSLDLFFAISGDNRLLVVVFDLPDLHVAVKCQEEREEVEKFELSTGNSLERREKILSEFLGSRAFLGPGTVGVHVASGHRLEPAIVASVPEPGELPHLN